MRWWMILLGIGSICCFMPAVALAKDQREREPMDDAIEQGLEYLFRAQAKDGSWSVQGRGDPGITSLAVMAFLSAGHVPGEGKYGAAVEKGVRYVLGFQRSNGLIAPPQGGHYEMYYHGICTLMLAEAAGMVESPQLAEELREKLQKAVQLICDSQRTQGQDRGGWRYRVHGNDADISVTGWQVMALRAAKNLGCDVPPNCIDEAVEYIKRCFDPYRGGFRYTVNGAVTIPCTGTSVLALELCGRDNHRSPQALKAGALILKTNLEPRHPHFFYGIYYTSQAMFQLGDNYWESYRPKLHDLLLKRIPQRSNGAWIGFTADDAAFGPNYCTAMAILALTVEYRFLPIYQRGEEPTGNEKN